MTYGIGIAVTVLVIMFAAAHWGAAYDRAVTARDKTFCIARGGSITEFHGGFTDWACIGAKQ